jgi:hypothetical protein
VTVIGSPLLLWSWRTLPGSSPWPAAARIRALAAGHAHAEAAGYRVVFYGDGPALRELDGLRWPWETRALPQTGADAVPLPFWSGTKIVALRDARAREPDGVPVVHCDHDGIVTGPLAGLDAPLFAQNREAIAKHEAFYPPIKAGADLPAWYQAWRKRGVVHECGLVGGASRYAVAVYCDEALRFARILDQRGTLRRVHTHTLEQGTHAAVAEELGARVGFALDERHRGKNYATWPGPAHLGMPLARLERETPANLRAAILAKFGPLPGAPSAAISPYRDAHGR